MFWVLFTAVIKASVEEKGILYSQSAQGYVNIPSIGQEQRLKISKNKTEATKFIIKEGNNYHEGKIMLFPADQKNEKKFAVDDNWKGKIYLWPEHRGSNQEFELLLLPNGFIKFKSTTGCVSINEESQLTPRPCKEYENDKSQYFKWENDIIPKEPTISPMQSRYGSTVGNRGDISYMRYMIRHSELPYYRAMFDSFHGINRERTRARCWKTTPMIAFGSRISL